MRALAPTLILCRLAARGERSGAAAGGTARIAAASARAPSRPRRQAEAAKLRAGSRPRPGRGGPAAGPAGGCGAGDRSGGSADHRRGRAAAARIGLPRGPHDAGWREERQPVASLLAGLAMMAQRPPLLAIAERGSTDEFVKVRVLLDSTLPVIRARTAALSAELRQGEQLEQSAAAARAQLIAGRRISSPSASNSRRSSARRSLSAASASGQALERRRYRAGGGRERRATGERAGGQPRSCALWPLRWRRPIRLRRGRSRRIPRLAPRRSTTGCRRMRRSSKG